MDLATLAAQTAATRSTPDVKKTLALLNDLSNHAAIQTSLEQQLGVTIQDDDHDLFMADLAAIQGAYQAELESRG
jgi:hypothetical protein